MSRRPAARKLGDVGEFPFIDRVARRAGRLAQGAWSVGIGDDAAVLRPRPGERVAVSTDGVVEGVHFRFDRDPPRAVGRRALVANLSDIAAMGARPAGFCVALAAPAELPLATADAIVDGLLFEARRAGIPLVGGNLTRAPETALTITIFGVLAKQRGLAPDGLLRSAGRPGDRLFVTGRLGAQALARAEADAGQGPLRRVPVPRIEAGLALRRLAGAGGCVDVSDGLASDLRHLARASGCGARVEADRVPRPRVLDARALALGRDPEALVFHGGEDYELVFSLRPKAVASGLPGAERLRRLLGVAVTEIGTLTPGRRVVGLPPGSGHRHF